MTQARLWVCTFGAAFTMLAAAMVATLLTPRFYGDLTRVGWLSEDDYGWRALQPQINTAHLRSVAVNQADVLVIGDSFSLDLLWQVELVKAGYAVATVQWSQTGPLCSDLDTWLHNIGWRGRWLILQSAERELEGRLQSSLQCVATRAAIHNTARTYRAPPTQPPARNLNWQGKVTTGVRTLLNTWRARRIQSELVLEGQVRVATVSEGCRLFSHTACDRAAFYAVDLERPALSEATLRKVEAFAHRHPNIELTWLVIPNKSSIYLKPDRSAGFGADLQRSGMGPDLFSHLTHASQRVTDLYPANETHLSTRGFGVTGTEVVRWLALRTAGLINGGPPAASVSPAPRTPAMPVTSPAGNGAGARTSEAAQIVQ